MKQKRLWARVLSFVMKVAVASGLFAALPASAQNLPSSPAPGAFSPWRTMHPSSFDVGPISLLEQCSTAESTARWLTLYHCQRLPEMYQNKQYRVVWINKVKLDILLGRVDGDPAKNARVHHNQEKQTGRQDRALLFDLGGGVYAYWFTGDTGKSCNNLAFVYDPPKPKPVSKPPVSAVLPATMPRYVRHTGPVDHGVQFIQGVVVGGDCEGDTYIPGMMQDIGDDVNSSGATRVDW